MGGAGVLNVRPFLEYVDYFVLGRAEGIITPLIDNIGDFTHESVVDSQNFSISKKYLINQTECTYPHEIELENGNKYIEGRIGCNHKCLFCGYTWHRKSTGGTFEYGDLWSNNKDVELAMLDMANGHEVDLNKLRTTAIDGMSERLRFLAGKRISQKTVREFTRKLALIQRPHQVKYYNIIGYPTETHEDWFEFLGDLQEADKGLAKQDKQASILLHSTPFRATPATPFACHPMSYKNYRKEVANVLGKGLKGNIIFQGNAIWAVESMGTESLPTVIQSAAIIRGTEQDADNIIRVATSKKFTSANMATKVATLESVFDVAKLFKAYTWETLPTRYLKTYADIERIKTNEVN